MLKLIRRYRSCAGAIKQLPCPAGQTWGEYVIDRKYYDHSQVYTEGVSIEGEAQSMQNDEFDQIFSAMEDYVDNEFSMCFQSPLCAHADAAPQLALPAPPAASAPAAAASTATTAAAATNVTTTGEWPPICAKLEAAITTLQKMQTSMRQIVFSTSAS